MEARDSFVVNDQTCDCCIWWFNFDDPQKGECYFSPPQLTAKGEFTRPQVRFCDYCHLFQKKESESERDKVSLQDLRDREEISVRLINILMNRGYEHLHELAGYSDRKLLRMNNIGKRSLLELKSLLQKYDICPKPKPLR